LNIEISVRTLASINVDSIKEAIEEFAEESDEFASGVVGPSFATSGPGSGWSQQFDVTDYAERALAREFGAVYYVDSDDGTYAELDEDDDVVWSEESCLDIDIPTVEEIVKYPLEAEVIGRDGPKYGADERECARVLALCEFLKHIEKMQDQDEAIESAKAFVEVGGHFDWETEYDEYFDEEDFSPVCRTTNELILKVDGEELLRGEALGYFTVCCSGGEQFSEWQDSDGAERDWGFSLIEKIIEEVLEQEYEMEYPQEPSGPKESPDGAYFLLKHGWEQPWCIKARYASEADANSALVIDDRKTTEANGRGAYGWGYAVVEADPYTKTVRDCVGEDEWHKELDEDIIAEVLAACAPTPATYKTASELKAAKDSTGKGIK